MKKMFILFVLCIIIGFKGISQAVIADPAVNIMRVNLLSELPLDPLLIPINTTIELKLPVINYNTSNAIPAGSCKIKIGLGSKLLLAPGFVLATVPTSNYFNWSSETVGGQVQVTGDLYASLPAGFNDSLTLRLTGVLLGTSTITTNFLVTNHNTTMNLSDENGNNNNTALAYNIVSGALPVDFTRVNIAAKDCAITINFHTAGEINVDRYEIEGSKNGRDFETIGTIDASNAGYYQREIPIDASLKAAQYFVRIKSVDTDQQYKYSEVRMIDTNCEQGDSHSLFPNPSPVSSSTINIRKQTGLMDGVFNILVLDMTGKKLLERKVSVANQSSIRFQHGMLPKGQYLVSIQKEDEKAVLLKFQKL